MKLTSSVRQFGLTSYHHREDWRARGVAVVLAAGSLSCDATCPTGDLAAPRAPASLGGVITPLERRRRRSAPRDPASAMGRRSASCRSSTGMPAEANRRSRPGSGGA